MSTLVVGTRGSALALWQARHVADRLRELDPGLETRLEIIRTSGDRFAADSQPLPPGKGVFVKEIEEALLSGRIDLAVHSLKDLPTESPGGLVLGAILARHDPRDALVSSTPLESLSELPRGSHIGTGSLRRRLQLAALRDDLEIVPIRGNVDTRIRKIETLDLAGVVLALSGLQRLDRSGDVGYRFSIREMVPAVGQGALAVEIRSDDEALRQRLAPLDDAHTRVCVEAERRFLAAWGGGCQVPLGAHAWIREERGFFTAFLGSPSGSGVLRQTGDGPAAALMNTVREVYETLSDAGAGAFFQELEASADARRP